MTISSSEVIIRGQIGVQVPISPPIFRHTPNCSQTGGICEKGGIEAPRPYETLFPSTVVKAPCAFLRLRRDSDTASPCNRDSTEYAFPVRAPPAESSPAGSAPAIPRAVASRCRRASGTLFSFPQPHPSSLNPASGQRRGPFRSRATRNTGVSRIRGVRARCSGRATRVPRPSQRPRFPCPQVPAPFPGTP